jgi:hypothetical protein
MLKSGHFSSGYTFAFGRALARLRVLSEDGSGRPELVWSDTNLAETFALSASPIGSQVKKAIAVLKTFNPTIVVMKSAQDGVRTYETGSLNRPRIRRIFV